MKGREKDRDFSSELSFTIEILTPWFCFNDPKTFAEMTSCSNDQKFSFSKEPRLLAEMNIYQKTVCLNDNW